MGNKNITEYDSKKNRVESKHAPVSSSTSGGVPLALAPHDRPDANAGE